jgi:predicted  nucleic acid-binding Zn-ribbon protein
MSKYNRLNLYLHKNLSNVYENTDKENELVANFSTLYNLAKAAQEQCEDCSPKNLEKWRKAYLGTLGALTKDGEISTRKSRQVRKMAFELVESKVDNNIPMPKMSARSKSDLYLVNVTEEYLKYEIDRTLTKYENDKSERSTYVDGTGWYKVEWDSLQSTHNRSGNLRIVFKTVDEIYPQPGVTDYKQLEYIFERSQVSLSKLYTLYNKIISSSGEGNMVELISCYYLNDDGIVGLFSWCPHSNQVVCNEDSWQIRKLRTCTQCGQVNPTSTQCGVCGGNKFKFTNAENEVLSEDIMEIYNPYEVGETDDENEKDHYEAKVFLSAGTEIPFYQVRQLPFVPRPAISSVNSIYGISEIRIQLENQDAINKVLTKAIDKTLKSGAVVTKPAKLKMSDTDDTFKIIGVRNAEEANMVQAKQILADTSQDITIAALLYDAAKASSGITNSFQGQKDTTASSGKAKQFAAQQSAGRIESLRVMKSAAFAGVYELMLKYLLAFSDESRKFVKTLPNGSQQEETWNKYMFLDKDKYGNIYYKDDFTFNTDAASTLSQNRVSMWQETTEKFIQGAFGNPAESRTLKLYWNTMDALQYPLAKIALAGIAEGEQHLPVEVEAAIMQNPQLLQMIMQYMEQGGSGSGGARPNSGPKGNGATHAANVERTNMRNRASNKEAAFSPQQGI